MSKVLIIAEAGVNHNGDIKLAKQLVDIASEAGADFVKFQTFKADLLVTASAVKAEYQSANTGKAESQLEMLRKLELSEADHDELITYCHNKNIQFLSTAFDNDSMDLLKRKGITIGKIPSGEITNLPYLQKAAKTFSHIILSTGMADMDEINAAMDGLMAAGAVKENITLLHCNTEYPTPMEDVNLNAMCAMQKAFDTTVGYSDHTNGIEVAIAAVALGAKVIEKHFTINRDMPGPDHKASLEPQELSDMIQAIRNIERAMGRAEKAPTNSEMKNRPIARKSIVASKDIASGDRFSENNITTKRPGTGLSPMLWYNVIGQVAKKNFATDDMIEL